MRTQLITLGHFELKHLVESWYDFSRNLFSLCAEAKKRGREALKEWQMKIMQQLMVQKWSRDYQKQVTKGGCGCFEVKKIEAHVVREQKPMEGLNDGVKQLGEGRFFFFQNKDKSRDKNMSLKRFFSENAVGFGCYHMAVHNSEIIRMQSTRNHLEKFVLFLELIPE